MVTTTPKTTREITLGGQSFGEDAMAAMGLTLEVAAQISLSVKRCAQVHRMSELSQLYIFYFEELRHARVVSTTRMALLMLCLGQAAVIVWLLVR